MPGKLKTRDVNDVEILDAGTWDASTGEITLTDKELDEMVANTNKLIALGLLAPPVKLGHPRNQKLLQQEGWPAAGWVGNLRKKGSKIVADLRKVPETLADLIDASSYRKVSCEFWKSGFKVGSKDWSPVLTAVALLGEELPAVATLDDLVKLFSGGQTPALTLHSEQRGAIPTFVTLDRTTAKTTQDDIEEDLVAAAEKFAEKAAEKTKGKVGAPRLRAFLDEVSRRVRELLKTEAALADEPLHEEAAKHSYETAGGEPVWSEVDKTALPPAAFALVEDPEKQSTWQFPHHFERDGTLHAHVGAIRAALTALNGSDTGKATDVPASARAHIEEHATRAEIGDDAKKEEAIVANKELAKLFGLPEDADDAAIQAKAKEFVDAKAKLSATEATVQELAAKQANREATERVDGAIRARKIRPAEKAFWVEFARDKPREFGEYVDKQAVLFSAPLGSEADAPDANATEQLNQLANERIAEAAKTGAKLSMRDALMQVTREQPQLARQYRTELRSGPSAQA